MNGREGWDQEFTKRMALIGFRIEEGREEDVHERLGEALKVFEHALYSLELTDRIEKAVTDVMVDLLGMGYVSVRW